MDSGPPVQQRSGEVAGRRTLVIVAVGLPALAALLLYWPTLRLPLFFDDLLHIRLAGNLDLASVWLPSADFGYYRPFLFLPFLVVEPLFGHYPPLLLHALSVAQHALNAALLAALVWRLWHRSGWALLAGLLAALYPFSYQAIAIFGNNIYPASVAITLLGLHSYLTALQRKGRGGGVWWLLTGLLFVVGLLHHEMGVLFGLLAGLLHWQVKGLALGAWRRTLHKHSLTLLRDLVADQPYLIFLALGGLYALFYPLLPTGSGPTGANQLAPKLLYLLQSAAYPFAWFGTRLPWLPQDWVVVLAFVLLLALSGWAARSSTNRLALLFGWGWWAANGVLLLVSLPTSYFLHGARLFYPGSMGIALVWAIIISSIAGPAWERSRGGPLPKVATAVRALASLLLLLFILASSMFFVRVRLQAFDEITRPVTLMAEVMQERPASEGVLLVNLPAWSAPAENRYPAGVEIVSLMGPHLFVEELVEENSGATRPARALLAPDLLTEPGYPYGTYSRSQQEAVSVDWAVAGSDVFITRYGEAGIEAEYAGRLLPAPAESATRASFGPYLLRDAAAGRCGEELVVRLTWEVQGNADQVALNSASIFVQLLSEEGELVSQADGPPLGLPPNLLVTKEGWQLQEWRRLPLADATGSHLLLGAYNYLTGERFSATDASGKPLPDNALTLPLGSCPESDSEG